MKIGKTYKIATNNVGKVYKNWMKIYGKAEFTIVEIK